jgi:two-component system chemotaxis response regulator CheY
VILVVDDDDDVREAVVDTILDEGYQAVAVPDVPAALAYLRQEPLPRLVLLDWNMTPLNALHFMSAISQEPAWSAIPVVLLTADARASDKAAQAAFAGFLRKPVRLPELFRLAEQYSQ